MVELQNIWYKYIAKEHVDSNEAARSSGSWSTLIKKQDPERTSWHHFGALFIFLIRSSLSSLVDKSIQTYHALEEATIVRKA